MLDIKYLYELVKKANETYQTSGIYFRDDIERIESLLGIRPSDNTPGEHRMFSINMKLNEVILEKINAPIV